MYVPQARGASTAYGDRKYVRCRVNGSGYVDAVYSFPT